MSYDIPAEAVGGFHDVPKQSIGNYKGVMLCNRPNEFGQQRKAENNGPLPFLSRVDPKNANPMGWNPCQKLFPKSKKKSNKLDGVLNRHKMFLQNLEHQKKNEREEMIFTETYEKERMAKFKENAQKQRTKISEMKKTAGNVEEELNHNIEKELNKGSVKSAKLTEENLSKVVESVRDEIEELEDLVSGNDRPVSKAGSKRSVGKSSKASKKSKPAWATTKKQNEENKEAEIDDLLEFAYELDYDQYMDDFEVRQVFAIVKDRVNEIRKDQDWKQKIAEEWNAAQDEEDKIKIDPAIKAETASVFSYRSAATRSVASVKSGVSMKERIADQEKRQAKKKAEWDQSTTVSKQDQDNTVEAKVASQIAQEILSGNQKLRGVHSGQSMKKIIEKEAKRQLLEETQGRYVEPVLSKVQERGTVNKLDPSNLPYLHKCPAV